MPAMPAMPLPAGSTTSMALGSTHCCLSVWSICLIHAQSVSWPSASTLDCESSAISNGLRHPLEADAQRARLLARLRCIASCTSHQAAIEPASRARHPRKVTPNLRPCSMIEHAGCAGGGSTESATRRARALAFEQLQLGANPTRTAASARSMPTSETPSTSLTARAAASTERGSTWSCSVPGGRCRARVQPIRRASVCASARIAASAEQQLSLRAPAAALPLADARRPRREKYVLTRNAALACG